MLCPCIFIVRAHHCFYRKKYICRQKKCMVLKNIIRLDSCRCLFSLLPMYWCGQKFWVSTNVSYVAKKAWSQDLLFLTLTKNPIPHYFSSHFLKTLFLLIFHHIFQKPPHLFILLLILDISFFSLFLKTNPFFTHLFLYSPL